jgi:hypothetical protein
MIPVLLRDLRWRMLGLAVIAWLLYLLEPGFHQHGAPAPEEAVALGAIGVSATLSYFAGLSMIVLLAGFISSDRREGYTRIFFSHPTRPLALYALRWAIALVVTLFGATAFLVIGQMIAWGEVRGGWSGLLLALVSAVIYGGLMAFLSAALPRGDAVVALVLFLPTFVPQLLALALAPLPAGVRQAILLLLPPQTALQSIWQALLEGSVAWPALAFAAGYGVLWILASIAALRARDLP